MNGSHAIMNIENWHINRYANPYGSLIGRVVLLFGENSETIRTLIVSFAKRGADVAIVCSDMSQVSLARLGRKVQELGRRLYFVDHRIQETADSDQTVSEVLDKFGRIDIIIDLSAKTYRA
jgi:NAD(P)-dependent dehydrogenase (short-subunit alcohol dehydrogenase family)